MRFDLRHGDSREVLATLDAASVDALVTDPPAGISFMGKKWDHDHGGRDGWIAAFADIFRECLRILKPGAHGLVWALPRTSHWTATVLEDAGFEIRDVGIHLFGTGFPKSLNLGDGRGTALKPAAEHWILVRKPLDGTVAGNVAAHGTGALNIDACRLATDEDRGRKIGWFPLSDDAWGRGHMDRTESHPLGRWPANVTLDEEAAALLDAQSGEQIHGAGCARDEPGPGNATYDGSNGIGFAKNGTGLGVGLCGFRYGDSGGASRFFYVAKPDRGERDIGCEDLPAATGGEATDRKDGSAGTQNPRAGAGRNGGARNIHPTVKSVDLMRWLCRLVTPKGGLVLDPFMGSGSTGIACAREGMRFIGIERERAYFEIARRRIVGDAPLLNRIGQLPLRGPGKDEEGAA